MSGSTKGSDPACPGDLAARNSRLSPLSAPGRVARGARRRPAASLPGRGLLGRPLDGFGDPAARSGDRRPGARRPRRQPHRPHVHRRPLGRLALRRAASRRLREPADEHPPRRRASTARRLRDRRGALRPPANRPTPEERDDACPIWSGSWRCSSDCRTIVALGGFAWDGALRALRALGDEMPRPKPRFGHGAEAAVGRWTLLGCYHPSQQNTFTGRLTEPMLDAVFARARELSAQPSGPSPYESRTPEVSKARDGSPHRSPGTHSAARFAKRCKLSFWMAITRSSVCATQRGYRFPSMPRSKSPGVQLTCSSPRRG